MYHPVVLLSPVDTFPIGDLVVTTREMEECANFIVHAANVVRFGIAHEDALAAHGERLVTGMKVHRCPEWEHCSGSGGLLMDAALWNRAHLASVLQDGWSISQVEAEGGEWMHSRRPDLISVGLVPGLFHTAKLVDQYRPRAVRGLGRLDPRDAHAVREAMPGTWEELP